MELTAACFADFFSAIHGCQPFPWQQRLVERLVAEDAWPDALDLPTSAGKTAALDAAVFHLAIRADDVRRAALRIAIVVDRRLVVDDAYERAQKIACTLTNPESVPDPQRRRTVAEVAKRLADLAESERYPLVVQRLRGGAPLEDDWARTPTQPTILCSTVDQVGSRLLFRGYGISNRMRPIHAGLLGCGSLILLDEAHLAQPFCETAAALRQFGQAHIKTVLLTATPYPGSGQTFGLSVEDRAHSVLGPRLRAPKPARLIELPRSCHPAEYFATAARTTIAELEGKGIQGAAVAVILNRVMLARRVFDLLTRQGTESILLIGRSRSAQRAAQVDRIRRFKTGESGRETASPLVIVATQCLEVGVDLDLDGLLTQAAPLDSLRQRFGRLNRAGRPARVQAEIVALPSDVAQREDDPVYGDRIHQTWAMLTDIAENGQVDFGITSLETKLVAAGVDIAGLSSPTDNAPVLMPAYLDLWAQTSPISTADPDVSLFLHGKGPVSPDVSLVWRDDVPVRRVYEDDHPSAHMEELLEIMPPRATEALSIPIWAVRSFLAGRSDIEDVADVPDRTGAENSAIATSAQPTFRPFRWAGANDPRTRWIHPDEIRVGDVLVLPSSLGGCDEFGWHPGSTTPTADIADDAARPYRGRRHAVRVSREVAKSDLEWAQLTSALASEDGVAGVDLIDRLLGVLSGDVSTHVEVSGAVEGSLRSVWEPLQVLRQAKENRIRIYEYPRSSDSFGGAILIADKGVDGHLKPVFLPATEDDSLGNIGVKSLTLDTHSEQVEERARSFARALRLGDEICEDIALAAYLHDIGKADKRFQVMLAGGAEWNAPENHSPLAKSTSWSPHAWRRAKLPAHWRHEAQSVRMIVNHPRFLCAKDPELVLWLVGTHHGFGRPFYGFVEDEEHSVEILPCLYVDSWPALSEPGPQSLEFNFHGKDWATIFESLKRRYGIWDLAHLEAILRLADHRASEEA